MIIYKEYKTIGYNFFWRALQLFFKQGSVFLITIFSAKLLSPENFGVYSYILAAVYFFIIIGDFGISIASSRYVAEAQATKKEDVSYIFFNSAIIIFGFSLLMIAIIYFASLIFNYKEIDYILLISPVILLIPLVSLYDGIYRGLKEFKKLAIIVIFSSIITLPFIYVLINNFGLSGALLSQVLFFAILLLFSGLSYKNIKIKIKKEIMKKILKYSILIGISNIGFFMYTKTGVLILGYKGYLSEVGHYQIIDNFIVILLSPAILLATVVAPNISELSVLKRFGVIYKKLKKEVPILFGLALVAVLIMYLISPLLLNYFSSYDYSTLSLILYLFIFILFPFRFISDYINVGYITASGYAKILTITTVIFGIFNLFISIWFVNLFGFIGAVYGIIISQLLLIFVTSSIYLLKIKKQALFNK